MNCEEARELITALVDNELSDLERSLIQGHLKECSRCRWGYEQERALKREIHNVGISITAPADLKKKILTDHGMLPKGRELSTGWKKLPFGPFGRPAFAFALLLLVLLPTIYFLMQPQSERISLAALQTQSKIERGELSLRTARNQKELRDWQTRAVDGRFAPMAYDLSAMRLQPVGGLVQNTDGRQMLVTVYSGTGQAITCFTFLGTEEDAPENAASFFDTARKTKFYTFSKDGLNAVFHREGDVICILVSKMRLEELLTIAMGKIEAS
jgi:Putative zinc-finger